MLSGGVDAKSPGDKSGVLSQEAPGCWEDSALETEPCNGKNNPEGDQVHNHGASNLEPVEQESDVADSWEDEEYGHIKPLRDMPHSSGDNAGISNQDSEARDLEMRISDDLIDEELDREGQFMSVHDTDFEFKGTGSNSYPDVENHAQFNSNGHGGDYAEWQEQGHAHPDAEEEEWWEIWSDRDAEFYYHNKRTQEVVWNIPEDATVIRYGTGPDGGTPYYSPFYSKAFQAKIGAIHSSEVPPPGMEEEFFTIPPVLQNRTVSRSTDVSFGPGVGLESFSFDGRSERDFNDFLDFVRDGNRALSMQSSTSETHVHGEAGSKSGSWQLLDRKKSESPQRTSRGSLRHSSSSQSLNKKQCSNSQSPPRSRSFKGSASNRCLSPTSAPSQEKAKQRPLRAGRSPAPMMVAWGRPKSPLETLKSPFASSAHAEKPLLENRESTSLKLKEESIQEIVSGLSLSLEALPSFETKKSQGSIVSTPSLGSTLQPTDNSIKMDTVFGKEDRAQATTCNNTSEAAGSGA